MYRVPRNKLTLILLQKTSTLMPRSPKLSICLRCYYKVCQKRTERLLRRNHLYCEHTDSIWCNLWSYPYWTFSSLPLVPSNFIQIFLQGFSSQVCLTNITPPVRKTKFHNHAHRMSQPSLQQSLSWQSRIPRLSRIPCNLSWRTLFVGFSSHFQENANYLKLSSVSSLSHTFRLIVHSSFRHVHM
jgi:hypothetical protein